MMLWSTPDSVGLLPTVELWDFGENAAIFVKPGDRGECLYRLTYQDVKDLIRLLTECLANYEEEES